MKIMKLASAMLLAAAAIPTLAHATSMPGAQPAQQTAAAQTAAQPNSWVPPYGQPVHEKTRAQVYQELVQAEQDGQLHYLNSTLYAH